MSCSIREGEEEEEEEEVLAWLLARSIPPPPHIGHTGLIKDLVPFFPPSSSFFHTYTGLYALPFDLYPDYPLLLQSQSYPLIG